MDQTILKLGEQLGTCRNQAEMAILSTYRRWGLGGLLTMVTSSYQDEQKDIVIELNQKIMELTREREERVSKNQGDTDYY